MKWDTALRRELKRSRAAERRAIARRNAAHVATTSPPSEPMTWDQALKQLLRQARGSQTSDDAGSAS